MLPKEYPLWQSVYYYFRKWKRDGTLEEVHDTLASDIRKAKGKKITPSVGIIDSQSAKRSALGQENCGYDGGKKTMGRKRHIVTDTLGLLMVVVVHAANVHDSVAAKEVFGNLRKKFLRGIAKVFADGGYRGATLRDWVAGNCGWVLEIVKRNDAHKFKVLPKRWIVERTFAWISFQRRTSKDYERLTDSSIAFIQLSMVRVMLNKFK
jgi:putative transposase